MPRPLQNPNDKKQSRVDVQKAILPALQKLAEDQAKSLTEVANDAFRYYLEHAFVPPRWPLPQTEAGKSSESK